MNINEQVVSPLAYPDYNVLIHPRDTEKTVSIKHSFGLSVKIWSQFSRLVCFNWVRNEVFTSFILEKNLWIHDKLHVLIHEKKIS